MRELGIDIEEIINRYLNNGDYHGLYNTEIPCMCGGDTTMDRCDNVPRICKPYTANDLKRIYDELWEDDI